MSHSTEPSPRRAAADGHGQAALILVESLIHELVARSVLALPDAVTIIEVAVDAQMAIGDASADPASSEHSVELLTAIASSLRIDLADGDTEVLPEL